CEEICNSETVLTISGVKIDTNAAVQPFVEAMKKRVTRIFLNNVTITDEGIIYILGAMDNSPLTFWGIEDSSLSGRGLLDNIRDIHVDKLETVYIKNLAIDGFHQFSSLNYLENILEFLKNISVINSKVFLMPCETSRLLKRLEYLDFTGNLLTDIAIRQSLCRGTLQQLRSLNLSKNSIKSLDLMSHLVRTFKKLESLDLSQNVFSEMPVVCTWPRSLRYLNLSLIKLRNITACLPKSLHVLDLRGNYLTVFDIELPYLKELYISGNKFRSLPSGRWFPTLQLLQIQKNIINKFDTTDLKEYKNLLNLEAGYNTFECSCKFLAFMQQKVGQLVRIVDGPDSYVCDTPVTLRGQLVVDAHLSIFECHMMVAVSGLSTIVFLATLICGILCYKLHVFWYIRMTWAWLQAKRKRKINANIAICYDAFVSYSERDSEWVEEFLVQELEGAQPPFRLCLHKRDFLPGQWIADNIINAMEKSHTTLFVLSQHFISSEWCKYELNSHFCLFAEKNDTAVLILLEPISKETIPKRFCKLRKFMNSRTYLEWPEDEMQRPLFWDNLKVAIKRDA
ncbi:toll-like receptor 2, partial [Conger conger]|uniref:toll-like receptor 2 n=1 Tax=Conger conger TaxID=82655 RepID=UPI002A5A6E11